MATAYGRRLNINGDVAAYEHATTVRSKTTQSMSQPPFEIGDQVVFISDPVPSSERVIDIEWLDALVPHWQVTTIWWIGGLEFGRVADAAEDRTDFSATSTDPSGALRAATREAPGKLLFDQSRNRSGTGEDDPRRLL